MKQCPRMLPIWLLLGALLSTSILTSCAPRVVGAMPVKPTPTATLVPQNIYKLSTYKGDGYTVSYTSVTTRVTHGQWTTFAIPAGFSSDVPISKAPKAIVNIKAIPASEAGDITNEQAIQILLNAYLQMVDNYKQIDVRNPTGVGGGNWSQVATLGEHTEHGKPVVEEFFALTTTYPAHAAHTKRYFMTCLTPTPDQESEFLDIDDSPCNDVTHEFQFSN